MKLFKTLITSSARIPVVRNVANRFRGAVLSTTIRQNTSTANDPDRVLPFKKLPFNSAELDVENLPVNDTAEFGTRLWSTIAALKENKYTSVFLRVPLLYSHYIAVAG